MNDFADLEIRYQILLEGLKTGEAARLAGAVAEAERLVVSFVTEAVLTTMNAREWRKLEAKLKRLEAELAKVYKAHGDALLATSQKLAERSAAFEAQALGEQVVAKEGGKAATIAQPSAEAVATRLALTPVTAIGVPAPEFVAEFVRRQPKTIVAAVRVGYHQGKTTDEIVRGIVGTKARNRRDGEAAKWRRDAEAVARTVVQHDASVGRFEVYAENDDIVEGYRFIATLDSRTTIQCRSLDNKVFPVGEGPVPPLHVGCRSTTVPELAAEFDFLNEGATRAGGVDAKGHFGPVDSKTTYYDWLRTQPSKFQDTVLGKSRAKLFRDGGLSAERFAALNIDKNFQPLTLEEMQKLVPSAFKRAGLD